MNVRADVGVSLYALNNYDARTCNHALSIFRSVRRPTFAVLYDTFTSNGDCLTRFLRMCDSLSHGCFVEVHPRFTRKEGEDEAEVIRVVSRAVSHIEDLAKLHANSDFAITTSLEDRFSDETFKHILAALRPIWPGAIGRSSKDPSRVRAYGDFLELHGFDNGSSPCVANLDGVSVDTGEKSYYRPQISIAETRRWLRNRRSCAYRFLWVAGWQGLEDSAPRHPSNRRYRISNSAARTVNRLLRSQ